MMSRIIINRKREYLNGFRPYYIFVDDKKIGVVPSERAVAFDVNPGLHKMKLKVDWCGSPEVEFTIAEDEIKSFEASGFKYGDWLFHPIRRVIGIALLAAFVIFKLKILLLLYLPFGFLLLYYLTFGRNKYLQLHEKNSTNPITDQQSFSNI